MSDISFEPLKSIHALTFGPVSTEELWGEYRWQAISHFKLFIIALSAKVAMCFVREV